MLRPLALLLAILLLLPGCQKPEAEATDAGGAGGGASSRASEEAENAREFAAGQEARAWLAREDTRLFEISKDVGGQIVEDLYAAGSPKVVVTDATKLTEGSSVEVGATFMAELPADPAARKRVFDVKQKYYEEEMPEKDAGQKYLTINTD